jgi:hypothetical protein
MLGHMDHFLCDEVSIEHPDGTTECLDHGCTLPHELHQWHADCSAIVPPCACAPAGHVEVSERPAPEPVLATAA